MALARGSATSPRRSGIPTYYHRADAHGIGFDRTATGSDARRPICARDRPLLRRPRAAFRTRYLLWFHHVPWTYRLRSGGHSGTSWSTATTAASRTVAAMQCDLVAPRRPMSIRSATPRSPPSSSRQHARSRMVARRVDRLFPEPVEAAAAAGACAPAHPLSWYEGRPLRHGARIPRRQGSVVPMTCVATRGDPPCAL